MGLFDIFSNKSAERARDMANTGLNLGYGKLTDLYGQGRGAITSGYAKADDIWSNQMKDYDSLFKGGAEAYGDVSGAHGVEGLQRGTDLFKNSGQYGIFGVANDAARQGALRAGSAAGRVSSGNVDVDVMKKAADLAQTGWGSFQQGLLPYLGNYGSAIGSVGTARANAAIGEGTALNTSYTGQGGAANATETAIGQNNAGAELNKYQVGANTWKAIESAAKLAAAIPTGGASLAVPSLFSGFGGSGGSGSSISGGGGGYNPNTNMPLYSADGQRPLYA
jgi:hypothetical protein